MGALASLTPWAPEDDFLLKNAVEAGASLESLAKGAVQFSRRYTVQALQDRWYSLLYDPVISAEASACMVNLERYTSPTTKISKSGFPKGNTCSSKRKAKSVHSCYYAMRKRICNDPFSAINFGLLVGHSDDSFVHDGGDPLSGNCISQDTGYDNFECQGSNFNSIHRTLPKNLMENGSAVDGNVAAHAFYTPIDETFTVSHKIVRTEFPCIPGEDLHRKGNVTGAEELGIDDRLETDSFVPMPISSLDEMNETPEILCSDFHGNHTFNSTINECGASFRNMDLSPLQGMQIWTDEDAQESTMPLDIGLGKKAVYGDDSCNLSDHHVVDNMGFSTFDIPDSDSNIILEMQCDDMKSSLAGSEEYLEELSKSLLNFSNEEEQLLMEGDVKDAPDKCIYDNLTRLIHSPDELHGNLKSKPSERDTSMAPQADLKNSSTLCASEADGKNGSCFGEQIVACKTETEMPSCASATALKSHDSTDQVMYCTLNTEDPEVPSNDDVFLPFENPQVPSHDGQFLPFQLQSSSAPSSVWHYRDNNNPAASCKHSGVNRRNGGNDSNQMETESRIQGQSLQAPHASGSHPLAKDDRHNFPNCCVKAELPDSHPSNMLSRGVVVDSGGKNGITLADACIELHIPKKEETVDGSLLPDQSAADVFVAKSLHNLNGFVHIEESDIGKEHDDTHENYEIMQFKVGTAGMNIPEPIVNSMISDQEESEIKSDEDVPYYSDIEAMILDMDLDPDDRDVCEEVSTYLHDETKRAVIRLEQVAHSYMQRAIASHGALAIFYGRRSKHYIKKPQVLLGRATEDVTVDIDLSREGCANKISRRQAIIKLDNTGTFFLKNLGKCSISVDSKDIYFGQCLNLHSCCLIEIRGMPFLFELNQNQVKQYLNRTKENRV